MPRESAISSAASPASSGPAAGSSSATSWSPEDPADAVTPLSADFDLPDTAADQLAWLEDAGFAARVEWRLRDLAVFAAEPR